MTVNTHLSFDTLTPLDIVEAFADTQRWTTARIEEDELVFAVEGNYVTLDFSFEWREEMQTLMLSCSFSAGIPKNGLAKTVLTELHTLLVKINAQLLLGHFDLWLEESAIIYRHGIILHGSSTSTEHCGVLLKIAIETAERFFPVFQSVLWGSQTADRAMEILESDFETAGEA